MLYGSSAVLLTGAYYGEVPPVPIPNTVVKLIRAEDTWRVTAWKNRSVPVLRKYGWFFLGSSIYLFLNSSAGRACGC